VTKIATDKGVYEVGQPVTITFTETNHGAQPLSVLTGPTEFEVTQNGTIVWSLPSSPNAAQPTWLAVQPGQSYSQTATWAPSNAATGTFAASNPFDPTGSSATFQIQTTSPSGGSNGGGGGGPSTPVLHPSPVNATLSTRRHTYKLGQRIDLSLKLKDVSATRVAITPRLSTETITVQMGSTLVYETARKVRVPAPATIKPGHTLKLTTAWSGKANQAGIKNLSPGIYTITVVDNGYSAKTTVQLVARHHNLGR
jgi:hypothetical protein